MLMQTEWYTTHTYKQVHIHTHESHTHTYTHTAGTKQSHNFLTNLCNTLSTWARRCWIALFNITVTAESSTLASQDSVSHDMTYLSDQPLVLPLAPPQHSTHISLQHTHLAHQPTSSYGLERGWQPHPLIVGSHDSHSHPKLNDHL